MSINIASLIKKDFWLWLQERSDGTPPEGKNFWLVPLPRDDPGYQAAVDHEVGFLTAIRKVEDYVSPHISGVRFTTEDSVFVCVQAIDGVESLGGSYPDAYIDEELPFLLAAYVSSRLDLPAKTKVPVRLLIEAAKGDGLAGDFAPYLPSLKVYRLSDEYKNYPVELLFPAVYCDVFRSGAGAWLSVESRSLLLSIPEVGHDWLLREFLDVLASKQLGSMYLLAYRIVEFFFPLQGVNDLRNGIGASGSLLMVLEKCRSSLGWYWQHGKSARLASSMASTLAFITPLVSSGLVQSQTCSPADAAEKLVNIRNALSHQDFRLISYSDAEIKAAIRSAFIYCAEAFQKYAQW